MHGLMFPPPSKQYNVAVILASRGCAYNCSFCCSRGVWGGQVITRTPQNIISEIDYIINRFQTNAFFFSDLTFNSNKRRVLDLCTQMVKHGNIPPWYAMCTTNKLDSDIIKAMRAAGCKKIGFGVEALSSLSLNKIGKGASSSIEQTMDVLNNCDQEGILTKAYLIIGYPWEDKKSLDNFPKELLKLPSDEIRISYFTPFPGSRSFNDYQQMLCTNDWSKFNAIRDIVIRNSNGLLPEDIHKARKLSFRIFYNNENYWKRINKKIKQFPELSQSFSEFEKFLRDGNVLDNKDEHIYTKQIERSIRNASHIDI